jgi:hypothetical protein
MLGAALSTSALSAAGVVEGTVSMPDGKPAAGTPVWLFAGRSIYARETTDAAGRFTFSEHVARCSSVAAMPKGASVVWASLSFPQGGVYRLQAGKPRTVCGTVLGPDGKPACGVRVSVFEIDASPGTWVYLADRPLTVAGALPGLSAVTAKDGRFKLTGIPETAWAFVEAESDHLASVAAPFVETWTPYFPITLPSTGWIAVNPNQGSAVLRMAPKATVFGAVVATAGPAVGARVHVWSTRETACTVSTRTDADGRYSVEVPAGTYAVAAEGDAGLLSKTTVCMVRPGDTARVAVELLQGKLVEGRVPLEGEPADEWSARCWSTEDVPSQWRPEALSLNADGRFAFYTLDQRASIVALSPTAFAALVVEQGPQGKLDKVVVEDDSRHRRLGPLRVRVVDVDGMPVAGAIVATRSQLRRADANGVAIVDGTERWGWIYVASSDFEQIAFERCPWQGDALKITLMPGREVRGVVIDDRQRRVSGAICKVEVADLDRDPQDELAYEPLLQGSIDDAGTYRIPVPKGARFRMEISKPGYTPVETKAVELTGAGGVSFTDAVLIPNDRTEKGTAVDQHGRPLARAPVVAEWGMYAPSSEGGRRVTYTGKDGSFLMTGLPRGELTAYSVMDTDEFVGKSAYGDTFDLAKHPIVGARRVKEGPLEFTAGRPMPAFDDLEWIIGSAPATGLTDLNVVFLTGGDPATASYIGEIGRQRFQGRNPIVFVFDSAVSADETKALFPNVAPGDCVARVKGGPDFGWGGTGIFHRLGVPYVPFCVKLDRSGRQVPIDPEPPGLNGSHGTQFPFYYVMDGDDYSPMPCSRVASAGSPEYGLPKGRVYCVDVADRKLYFAVAELNGRSSLAFSEKMPWRPDAMRVCPLTVDRGSASAYAWLSGTELGYYVFSVTDLNQRTETVSIRALGHKVAEVELSGKRLTCTVRDSNRSIGFGAQDCVFWEEGKNGLDIGADATVCVDGRSYRLRLDPLGSCVFVDAEPDFGDFFYDGDSATASGRAYEPRVSERGWWLPPEYGTTDGVDGRWAATGARGHIRLPRRSTELYGSFVRRSGKDEWTLCADTWDSPTLRPGRLNLDPLDAKLTARRTDNGIEIQVQLSTPFGVGVADVKGPQGRCPVRAEFLDAAGRPLGAWVLQGLGLAGWTLDGTPPPGAVRARLKADFGPFRVKPAEVGLP